MQIATYNIWNSEMGMPYRSGCIIREISGAEADVICLQEVQNKAMTSDIAHRAGYPYFYFDSYRDSEEGLCILSNIPFAECESWLDHSNAIFCSVCHDNKTISVINIHLPWDSVAERERQIVEIVAGVHNKKCDLVFMAGDFNCAETSDVHRFLTGECRLDQKEAVPCWFDLASSYAELTASEIEPTLNFRENPRFKHNTIELNSRFDRILLRNTYPCEFPVLRNCMIFGKTIYEDIQLSASDHYGVMVDIGEWERDLDM